LDDQFSKSDPAFERLRVFLCHSTGDKKAVRELYARLTADGFLPWLDEKDLLPGQDWELEITLAVQKSDVVVVCLSVASVTKKGFANREIKFALDVADLQPEGTIYLIPLRLEPCIVPQRLSKWHWVDYFDANGYPNLVRSLQFRSGLQRMPLGDASHDVVDQSSHAILSSYFPLSPYFPSPYFPHPRAAQSHQLNAKMEIRDQPSRRATSPRVVTLGRLLTCYDCWGKDNVPSTFQALGM
jgi:hypothetical protein